MPGKVPAVRYVCFDCEHVKKRVDVADLWLRAGSRGSIKRGRLTVNVKRPKRVGYWKASWIIVAHREPVCK